jgi:hypothetical protein
MEHKDDQGLAPEAETPPTPEKRPYEAPRVESVRLSKEAAESLT